MVLDPKDIAAAHQFHRWTATLSSEKGPLNADAFRKYCVENAKGAAWQCEVGAENGLQHIQAVWISKKPLRWSTLYKVLQGLGYKGWLSPVKGGLQGLRRLVDYCRKEKTRVAAGDFFGFDNIMKEKKDSSAGAAVQALKDGMPMAEWMQAYPALALRSLTNAASISNTLHTVARRPLAVYVHFGKPGTGKTTSVFNQYARDEIYTLVKPSGNGPIWWDGYDHSKHRVVLIDEFTGWIKPADLLLWLDPAGTCNRVAVKGSFVPFNPAVIVLTSNFEWRKWFKTYFAEKPDHIQALHRRFTEIRKFTYKRGWKAGDPPNFEVVDTYDPESYQDAEADADVERIPEEREGHFEPYQPAARESVADLNKRFEQRYRKGQ